MVVVVGGSFFFTIHISYGTIYRSSYTAFYYYFFIIINHHHHLFLFFFFILMMRVERIGLISNAKKSTLQLKH